VSSPHPPAPRPARDFVPTEELIRQQGFSPINSVDDLPHTDPFESDQEFEEFLADLYRSRRAEAP
jgi:hypothetical protein